MNRVLTPLFVFLLLLVGCSTQPTPTALPTAQPTQPPTALPTAQPTQPVASEAASVHILRIDSYHPEFAWSGEISRGVLQGLQDNGYEVDGKKVFFEERYLDTKRNTTEEYFKKISEETIAYIRETKPDVVIVSDDNGARMIIEPMVNDGINFVILGLNGKPEEYKLDTSPYVAGVLERPHAAEMMGWIERVFGKQARISVLAEESLTTDRMFGDGTVEATIKATSVKLVDMTFTNDYAAWQEYVKAAPATSDVLFLGAYSTLRGANNTVVEPLEALKWTLSNSKIPVMGFWEEAVHVGTLGGPIISGYTQGYEAAVRATKILDGTSPQEIGFSAPPRGKLMVNRKAMEQWGVQIPLDLLEVSEVVEQ